MRTRSRRGIARKRVSLRGLREERGVVSGWVRESGKRSGKASPLGRGRARTGGEGKGTGVLAKVRGGCRRGCGRSVLLVYRSRQQQQLLRSSSSRCSVSSVSRMENDLHAARQAGRRATPSARTGSGWRSYWPRGPNARRQKQRPPPGAPPYRAGVISTTPPSPSSSLHRHPQPSARSRPRSYSPPPSRSSPPVPAANASPKSPRQARPAQHEHSGAPRLRPRSVRCVGRSSHFTIPPGSLGPHPHLPQYRRHLSATRAADAQPPHRKNGSSSRQRCSRPARARRRHRSRHRCSRRRSRRMTPTTTSACRAPCS